MISTGRSKQETLFNPTNHAYFNLSGDGKLDILSHLLSLNCQGMLELDDNKVCLLDGFYRLLNYPYVLMN